MLQILDSHAPACIYQPRPARPKPKPSTLSPMRRAWNEGRPALQYPERPAREPERDVANMTVNELEATQPRGLKNEGLSPFRPIDTRNHEVPTEYARARARGYTVLSADPPPGARRMAAATRLTRLATGRPGTASWTPTR